MPLHLESITNKESSGIISWLLQSQLNRCEDAYTTKDKLCAHCSKDIIDETSKEKIGEYIFTIKTNFKKRANEILDIDIVAINPHNAQIKFLERLNASSDANEYYDVEAKDGGRFQIETVNRYLIEKEIEGEEYSVQLSAFPFKLSLYDTIEVFNAEMGFSEAIKVGETDMTVYGYSEKFIAPGDLFKDDPNSDETFSFVIGKVSEIKNIRIKMNDQFCDFIIAQLDTAVGNLTTVINRERYDVETISVGKIIAMEADIKANFKLTDKYPRVDVVSMKKENLWSKIKKIFK